MEQILVSKELLLRIKDLIADQSASLHCEFGACKDIEDYIVDGDMPNEYYELVKVLGGKDNRRTIAKDTDEVTYEIMGYKNQKDFDNVKGELIADGIISERLSMEIGFDSLHEYEIVKVQSSDRELIEILKAK